MTLENVDDLYPLSPMQQLMLMHSLRGQGSSTLANQFRYRITGPLDAERFTAAWQQVIDRHAALRTAFVWQDIDQPVQVVRSHLSVPLEFIDLSQKNKEEQQREIDNLQLSDRERGFDLLKAPLFRLTLIRCKANEHLLLWSRHHLILDLWSVEILFRELFAAYRNHSASNELPPAGSFRDYIAWLEQQDREHAEAFWREYLHGCTEPTLLFSQRARRSTWSGAGQPAVSTRLDADLTQKLNSRIKATGITVSTLIQGAFALLIAERCGRDDITFGLTVSSRPQNLPDVEHMMGSFINNVPVRVQIDTALAIVDWLAGMQKVHVRRVSFDYVSPIDIQRWSGLPARLPLFDVLLLVQNPQTASPESGELEVESLKGPYDTALPLTLAAETGAGGITLTAVYDDAAVSPDDARGLLEALCGMLTRLAARFDGTVGDVLERDLRPPRQLSHSTEDSPVDGETQEVLLDIWRRALGVPDVGLDDDFFALGGTSLQAAMAFAEIEQRLDRELPLALLFTAGSVRKLMDELQIPATQVSSLVGIQRQGSRPPILTTSGIGGNVVGLAALARGLGDDQPFYGLQSKGLVGDELPDASIEDIAAGYLAESKHLTDNVCVLFGICFGADVVLEMAHQLTRQGCPPALLIVLDPVYAPQAPRDNTARHKHPGFVSFALRRLRLYRSEFRQLDGPSKRRYLKDKLQMLVSKVRQRDALQESRFELRQQRIEAANLAAARRYRHEPYSGETRVLITADRVIDLSEDPRQAWVEVLAPDAKVERIPGKDTGDALEHHPVPIANCLRLWLDEISN